MEGQIDQHEQESSDTEDSTHSNESNQNNEANRIPYTDEENKIVEFWLKRSDENNQENVVVGSCFAILLMIVGIIIGTVLSIIAHPHWQVLTYTCLCLAIVGLLVLFGNTDKYRAEKRIIFEIDNKRITYKHYAPYSISTCCCCCDNYTNEYIMEISSFEAYDGIIAIRNEEKRMETDGGDVISIIKIICIGDSDIEYGVDEPGNCEKLVEEMEEFWAKYSDVLKGSRNVSKWKDV